MWFSLKFGHTKSQKRVLRSLKTPAQSKLMTASRLTLRASEVRFKSKSSEVPYSKTRHSENDVEI